MIYSFLFSTLLFLSGCIAVNEPLIFENKNQPIYVQGSELAHADFEQLKATLYSNGIVMTDQHNFDGYKLVINSLSHQSRDLYDDPSTHNLYLTVTSYLDATLYNRETNEALWSEEFKTYHSFKPNMHFYSDQEWARAGLIWKQQRILFNQLSDNLIKTCKKEPIHSGT